MTEEERLPREGLAFQATGMASCCVSMLRIAGSVMADGELSFHWWQVSGTMN